MNALAELTGPMFDVLRRVDANCCFTAGEIGANECEATNMASAATPRRDAKKTTGRIEDSSGGTSGASPRTKSPQSSRKGDWFGYCQYSPTDMLAHDHC